MKILLIEDTELKKEQIAAFISSEFSSLHLEVRKSYNSGLREILKNQDYSLILLDMSLPNYDISHGETGGDFESLAGSFLLQEMYRRDININVAIVTMYKNYTDEEFNSGLKDSFSNYLGVVYFNFKEPDVWKNELRVILNTIEND